MTRELGVEECLESGRRHMHAIPALGRIAEGQWEPRAAHRRLSAGTRRMRRDEGGVLQERLPGAADLDQVVAVRAIAVHEHDELARRAVLRREAGTVDLTGHGRLAS